MSEYVRAEASAYVSIRQSRSLSIDLVFVVLVDVRAGCHTVVVGVVCAREFAVELKLSGVVLPFLPQIVQNRFSYIVGNV